MSKIICDDCDYHAYACGDHFCKHDNQKIGDADLHYEGINYFADWCPLPDKEAMV